MPRRPWCPEHDMDLQIMHATGTSARQIARVLTVSAGYRVDARRVSERIIELNLPPHRPIATPREDRPAPDERDDNIGGNLLGDARFQRAMRAAIYAGLERIPSCEAKIS